MQKYDTICVSFCRPKRLYNFNHLIHSTFRPVRVMQTCRIDVATVGERRHFGHFIHSRLDVESVERVGDPHATRVDVLRLARVVAGVTLVETLARVETLDLVDVQTVPVLPALLDHLALDAYVVGVQSRVPTRSSSNY